MAGHCRAVSRARTSVFSPPSARDLSATRAGARGAGWRLLGTPSSPLTQFAPPGWPSHDIAGPYSEGACPAYLDGTYPGEYVARGASAAERAALQRCAIRWRQQHASRASPRFAGAPSLCRCQTQAGRAPLLLCDRSATRACERAPGVCGAL